MIDDAKKHAISELPLRRRLGVLFVAILFATYHIFQLEAGRYNHRADVEEEFDRAVRALRECLPAGNYQVQLTQPLGTASHAFSRRALVINRAFPVPRIEAELYIDQQRASEQRKRQPRRGRSGGGAHSSSKRQVSSPIRFRAYDPTAMVAVAEKLLQRQLIAVVE